MTHIDSTVLLLYAYNETPASENAGIETHLAGCSGCREQLRDIELAREAATQALAPSTRGRRKAPVVAVGLAAAVLAFLVIGHQSRPPRDQHPLPWESRNASATAGYVTGDGALLAVDSVLTSLEGELSHAAR
jgi:hypothetical protein